MSDFSITAYQGGGHDGWYGNNGGSDRGPTSYNPWGGSGSSTYIGGPGVAMPSGAANRFNGRVSPISDIRVISHKLELLASGTAAQLLPQADAIIRNADDRNRNFAGDRAPDIYMPGVSGGVSIDFDSGTQFKDYLRRSAEVLIPNELVRAAAQSVLGRTINDGEVAGMQGAINAGGSLSTVRWDAAHSAEAAARVNEVYQSVLGRQGEPTGIKGAQDALGGGMSLQDLRSAAAYSAESSFRLGDMYQQVLGRALDAGSLGNWQNAIKSGWALRDVRWDVAHSGEAWGRVSELYTQVLGRTADPGNVTHWQDALGGGWKLGGVRWDLAHSGEAWEHVSGLYTKVLGRAADSGSVANWQDALGGGWTLRDVRSNLAHSGESWGRVSELYTQVLGRAADAGSVTNWQDALGGGWALRDVRWDLAHSGESQGGVSELYTQVLGRAADAGSVTNWQDALGGGWALRDVRWDLAHSGESQGRVSDLYLQVLGRAATAGNITGYQDALGGSWQLSWVRADLAHSGEARSRVSDFYTKVLGRAGSSGDLTSWQERLSGGWALRDIRWDLAHSSEAVDRVNDIYVKLLNHGLNRADKAAVTSWQDRLGQISLAEVRLAVAHTPEAQVDFDGNYYLEKNPDVKAAGADPYLHFIDYGWKEGRNPNAFFNSSYYLKNNLDVVAAGINPLLHYRTFGWHEGRNSSAQFDTVSYLKFYRDVAAAGIDPLSHFLTHGIKEGRIAFTVLRAGTIKLPDLYQQLLGRPATQGEILKAELDIRQAQIKVASGFETALAQGAVPSIYELQAGQPLLVSAVGPVWVTAPTGDQYIDTQALALGDILKDVVDVVSAEPNQGQPLFGIKVHAVFARLLRAGAVAGISAADVETSFSFGDVVSYGTAGARRTDIIIRNISGEIVAIADVKTGNAQLTAARAIELRKAVGVGNVPIIVLRVSGISLQ